MVISNEATTTLLSNQLWLSDSGSSDHITGDLRWFEDYKEFKKTQPVYLTDLKPVQALGKGTVALEAYINNEWEQVTLENVLYVPNAVNLFSVGKMVKKGFTLTSDLNRTVFWADGRFRGPEAEFKDDVFMMKFRPIQNLPVSRSHCINARLWHQRLSHVNMQYIKDSVRKEAIRGIPMDQLTESFDCEDCQIGKQTRKPYPPAEFKPETVPGEMAHMDIAGKFATPSLGGSSYFLLITDDAT